MKDIQLLYLTIKIVVSDNLHNQKRNINCNP